ncbi:MAG: SDR family NAD(P)-dependent oxidoreductase [Actinomycetota bacterium]
MSNKWTADDIGDQDGRVAVITGANTGLGLETARALAAAGASVVLAVRNVDKGAAAIDDIRADLPDAQLDVLELDLASLDSIRTAAEQLDAQTDRVDLLINNAGVMYTPRQETADGFEMQFGTNHLGHFAFTGHVLDQLLTTEGSRIVTVSSVGHRILSSIDFDDINATKSYNRVAAYGRSKLANLLFTYELQRRLDEAGASTIALAAHPGGSDTDLVRHVPGAGFLAPAFGKLAQSAAMGALPQLRAATDPTAQGGQYYGPDGFMEVRGHPVVVESNSRSNDADLQQRLWAVSEDMTGVEYPFPATD